MDLLDLDQTSETYLGQWRHLVSTTNWEKGRIISEWRSALARTGASSDEYSDDAWSRRVGHVSPQHVGRLRRVFDRFGGVYQDYEGSYWSHFQAALDWDDAEMWLEGVVQNDWSVSEMRRQRWTTLYGPQSEPPRDAEDAAQWDEDAEDADELSATDPAALGETLGVVRSARGAGDPHEPEAAGRPGALAVEDEPASKPCSSAEEGERAAPFANLPPLPSDVSEAFDAFKLCILRHKLAGFQEISRSDLLASLDALKSMLLAPA